tara:strand:+ start:54398 stop:56467 length:2070 start_codon:yes stop_codon:yes gene_type:complete
LKNLFFFIYLVLGINLVSTTTALGFDKSIPIPPPFSGQDAQYFQQAIRAAETGKYTLAIDLANKIQDSVAKETIIWLAYSAPFSFPSFEEVSSFITTHQDWPRQVGLRSSADRALSTETSDETVLNWYHLQDPASSLGRIRLAEALFNNGDIELGIKLIKKSWHEDEFSINMQRSIEKKFKPFLTNEDHIQRLDNLLWKNRYRSAKRMFPHVSEGHESLAKARLALRNFEGGVDRLISNVPISLLNDPGLIYERVRWRRSKGKHESAQELLLATTEDQVEPKRWWIERNFQVRRLLQENNINKAYQIAAEHGQIHSKTFSEAEWLAGWIALRKMNNPKQALKHFSSIYNIVFMPISRSRAAYWSGRANILIGNQIEANSWYRKAAQFCTAFYGQLAIASLARSNSPLPKCSEKSRDMNYKNSEIMNHPLFASAYRLAFSKNDKLTNLMIRQLARISKKPQDYSLISSFSKIIERPDSGISAAKQASRNGYHSEKNLFPIPKVKFTLPNDQLEHALVLAVIRQESQFYDKAISYAGARGLMQLMPRTAKFLAKKMKIPYRRSQLIHNPGYNIKLGSFYLKQLIERFDGSYPLAIAAYNAGPTNVKRWIKKYGDPRTDPQVDIVDWLEQIPLGETRNYVQRVIEGLQVYRYKIALNTPFGIETDLTSGFNKTETKMNCSASFNFEDFNINC